MLRLPALGTVSVQSQKLEAYQCVHSAVWQPGLGLYVVGTGCFLPSASAVREGTKLGFPLATGRSHRMSKPDTQGDFAVIALLGHLG